MVKAIAPHPLYLIVYLYYKNINLAIALMNRDELLKRYAAGERDFSGVDLSRAVL